MEMETLRLQTIVHVVGHIHFLNTILASSSTIGLLSSVPQHSLYLLCSLRNTGKHAARVVSGCREPVSVVWDQVQVLSPDP